MGVGVLESGVGALGGEEDDGNGGVVAATQT